MPKILITNTYPNSIRQIINTLTPVGFELLFVEQADKGELLRLGGQVDYFLVGGRLPIDEEVLKSAKNLKMIQRTGVGLDQMDLEALRRNAIPLYVNKGVNAVAVAEHTLMLLLALLRKVRTADDLLRKGVWKKQALGVETFELTGKTIGLIGLGNIGLEFVKMLQPFGLTILYNKPNRLSEDVEKAYGLTYITLDELLGSSDIISLHCALEPNTRNIINKDSIAKMKDHVFIVNTSRGKLIEEKDLIDNLLVGKIAGAGLDVFTDEPLPPGHPLSLLDNVVLTPHIGGITHESFSRMYTKAFENIVAYEQEDLSKIKHLKVV